jgi:hypothetical protein
MIFRIVAINKNKTKTLDRGKKNLTSIKSVYSSENFLC